MIYQVCDLDKKVSPRETARLGFEPIAQTRKRVCAVFDVRTGHQNKKDTLKGCPFVLVTRTGIEPMFSA